LYINEATDDKLYYNLWNNKNLAAYLARFLLVPQELNESSFAINSELMSEQQSQATNLLLEYTSSFAEKISKNRQPVKLEQTNLVYHEINTKNAKPIKKHPYEKIKKIKEFPVTVTIKQIRLFLSLVSYYRKFIKGFLKIAKPLNQLLKKDEPYHWTDDQNKAFQKLKQHLMTTPVLRYPNFNQPFYLHTDTSTSGLGAVLAQLVPGS
ncbi:3098_t:CDS:2, partial [Racocetra fulgida]